MDSFEGFFTQHNYRLQNNQGNGKADRIDFVD